MYREDLVKELMFYLDEECSAQLLYDFKHYAVKELEFYKELPNSWKATGIKINTGEVREDGTAVIAFDVDCKEREKEGKEFVKVIMKEMPLLFNTRRERTKSGGYHFFLRVPMEGFETVSKVVFSGVTKFDDLFKKPIEIEVFMNAPLTVAPTLTHKGNYLLSGKATEIKEISKEELQQIMRWLASKTLNYDVVNKGRQGRSDSDVVITEVDMKESLEIMDANKVKYAVMRGGKVSVWDKNDGSINGDYILNSGKVLWNLKTYERKCLKEWIREQNGGIYLEREIKFGR